MTSDGLTLYIEACLKSKSFTNFADIRNQLEKYLEEQEEIVLDALLSDFTLPPSIKYIRVCSNVDEKYKVNVLKEKVFKNYHIYQLWEDHPQVDSLEGENEEVPASLNWCLPNVAFEGLWESLILENGLKEQLMSYVQTTLLYSSHQVNAKVVHWNGLILLHGPPGTGEIIFCFQVEIYVTEH